MQDLRYAIRTLAKSPWFSAVAVVGLALGLGFNTTLYSIVKGVLWSPLPYADPDRLIRIGHARPESARPGASFSPQDFEDLEREHAGLASLSAYEYVPGLTGMNLTEAGEPARISVAFVSGGFFATLGTEALIGRALLPEENAPGRDGVVVLSNRFWQRQFGGDRGAVGRTVRLDGRPFTIVGVLPAPFVFPSGDVDLYAPLSLMGEDAVPHRRGVRWLSVVARLAPGVSPAAARASADRLFASLERDYPDSNGGFGRASVQPLADSLLGDIRAPLLLLSGAVGLVLLITCANLASLLLARGGKRVREIAIRTALGASRARVVRQLLAEAVLLAVAGGVAGLLVAFWSVEAIAAAVGAHLPRVGEVRVDAGAAGFSLLLALATGVAFGLIPALHGSRPRLASALEGAGRSGTSDRSRRTILRGLVVAESAIAVVLLAGAGLLSKSFWRLTHADTGLRAANVLTLSITIPAERYPEETRESAYRADLLQSLRALPGVTAVGASKTMPLKGGGEPYSFRLPGQPGGDPPIRPDAGAFIVTPGYFAALGIPLFAGRDFTEQDLTEHKPVLVVNRALARRLWPGESAVGKAALFGRGIRFEVIGVAGDVRQDGLAQPAGGAIYVPVSLFPRSTMKIFVRSAQEPAALAAAARAAIRSVDGQQPVSEVATFREVLAEAVGRPRFVAALLCAFGAVALALAALGVYGVLTYTVSQRTREIGVRMALGARSADILRNIIAEGAALSALGVAVAVPAALAASRFLRGLLFEVRPSDPGVLALVCVFLVVVAALSAALPARRAARIDPMEALRHE